MNIDVRLRGLEKVLTDTRFRVFGTFELPNATLVKMNEIENHFGDVVKLVDALPVQRLEDVPTNELVRELSRRVQGVPIRPRPTHRRRARR